MKQNLIHQKPEFLGSLKATQLPRMSNFTELHTQKERFVLLECTRLTLTLLCKCIVVETLMDRLSE